MGNGARMGEKNAFVMQTPIITRLSFNQPPDDTLLAEPLPIEKQQPRPLKTAEAEPVLAKPAKENPTEKKPIIRQKKSVEITEPVRQAVVQEQVKDKNISHASAGLLEKERQLYLHKLVAHIESFKYYPRAARKRSLEGDVNVSFMLLDDGYYVQLKLDGEHSLLVKATRSAMESAAPLPSPPEGIILPRRFEFTMSYSLTH
jgi:protein TonB